MPIRIHSRIRTVSIDPTTPRFRIAPLHRFRLGELSDLVYFPSSRATKILPRSVVKALASCTQFLPLSTHADALSALIDRPFDLLEELRTSGCLISFESLVKSSINNPGKMIGYPRISCVAIPTGGRIREFERALRSYIISLSARNIPFLIADDSPTVSTQEITRSCAESLARSSGASISYAGRSQKEAYVKILAEGCAAPREIIDFALIPDPTCQVRTGANRNSVLVHTVGQLIMTVDDDTVCQIGTAASGRPNKSLTLGGELDLSELRFFSSRRKAMETVDRVSLDLLSEHEKLLGKPLNEIVGQDCFDSIKFRDPCAHLLGSLTRNQGVIPITYSGVVGDSGMHSSENIGGHPGLLTRQSLTRSEEAYQEATSGREVVRQVLSTSICHSGAPMTSSVGMDNRGLLPPFFPRYRKQDGVFEATLKRCMKNAYFGHLPFVLTHDPLSVRSNISNPWRTIRISDYLIQCIAAWPEPVAQDTLTERLKSLGKYLIEISSQPLNDFNETIRVLLLQKSARTVERLESLLTRFNRTPEFWARDLTRQIEELNDAMLQPAFVTPVDLMQEFSPAEIQIAAQGLVAQFGLLLHWWPDIIKSANDLSSRGISLGQIL